MKRWFSVSTVILTMIIILIPHTSQAASPTAPAAKAEQSQPGGILKVLMKGASTVFGYPPRMVSAARDYAPPFFDRLFSVGDDGKYKPGLALSWDASKDGKTITFKLRKGVTFHDGTPFNAQAVKFNIDNLIPPKATLLNGITSVDVVDDYTVRLNLTSYNNLILFHFASNPVTYIYSPDALKKNGADWATTHPIGTGAFMLKDYQPNTSVTLVRNPNYWQKGLPYLDGIVISMVADPMAQILSLKSGQAQAIYNSDVAAADQLRDAGYPVMIAPGSLNGMNFDIKNSEIFSKRQVREAIEYAIDKEAICSGPGKGFFIPLYQIVSSNNPDFNPDCPPRKYDPAKAKKLLAEAGYPNGFSFKQFILGTTWKDGWVAVQNYLNQVGIKMEINYVNAAQFSILRTGTKMEKDSSIFHTNTNSSNTLFTLDAFLRSDSANYPYVVKPAGIYELIDKAKSSRDLAEITKINRQILKLIHDDVTIIPLWLNSRLAIVDKSVQDTGWFIYGDDSNNEFGISTWLKK